MACNNSTLVYWAGNDFATAPQLYQNSTLTTLAPPGLYSFGGVYRIMSATNVLSPPIKCPACLIDCASTSIVRMSGSTSPGSYFLNVNLTSGAGAVILRFNPNTTPSQLTWTHDGLTASEYSSVTHGYKQGVIGQYFSAADGGTYTCNGGVITSNSGSNSQTFPGFEYEYETVSGNFVPKEDNIGNLIPVNLGPYNASQVDLFSGVPGYFTMVVPKPNVPESILNLRVDVICPNADFFIDVNCARALNSFTAGVVGGGCGVYSTNIFTASVATATGVSTTIGVNDWAFVDVNGVTQLPAGRYPVLIGPGAGVNHFVDVDSNGIVTAVAAC